jgi:hypothetical protein
LFEFGGALASIVGFVEIQSSNFTTNAAGFPAIYDGGVTNEYLDCTVQEKMERANG